MDNKITNPLPANDKDKPIGNSPSHPNTIGGAMIKAMILAYEENKNK
jgi:hypothetical protein